MALAELFDVIAARDMLGKGVLWDAQTEWRQFSAILKTGSTQWTGWWCRQPRASRSPVTIPPITGKIQGKSRNWQRK